MKINAAIFLFLITFLSCTRPPLETAQPVKVEAPMAMPSIQIETADRSCEKDSDCVQMPTQCSCSCGEGVNKLHSLKYSENLSKKCENYNGRVCKVKCDGEIKCKEKMCTYVYK